MDLQTVHIAILLLSSGTRVRTFQTRQPAVQLDVWRDIYWVSERQSMSEVAHSVAQTCLAVSA